MPILGAPILAGAGGGAIALGGGAAAGTGISTSVLVGGAAVVGTGLLLSGDTPVNSTATGAVPALAPGELQERLKKVQALAKQLSATAAESCATGNCCQKTIVIPYSSAPESAKHIDDAQRMGFPSVLTYDANPIAAKARRAASTSGVPRYSGMEPDEYPPAAFMENGGHASVRNIDWRDNRVSGGIIGANVKGLPAGCRITLITGP
ncbi:NucA/NucB deoxyribonuclease domain-containing protein [Rhizobium sp. CNPSo 4062]|uniref:NucA/NucB deoxyribonuclease domain-containing protein n=1 Tax=Rhizobium sp. CNPSo 4062 TaxID=3021410 RepID=UPI00254B66E8|nr:NucA/NucB deoxyribonuclease domain-containing protein [Rhizobium sp. CNPSo 4062]MDK4706612.1 NucA/NucB deoxyribonuclease domain-containing protein [Rhizobium sp. CNPSo 4062]